MAHSEKKTLSRSYETLHRRWAEIEFNPTWGLLGPFIEAFNIGSEGGSAWVWVGPDPSSMRSVGFTANSQLGAIIKVLRYLKETSHAP